MFEFSCKHNKCLFVCKFFPRNTFCFVLNTQDFYARAVKVRGCVSNLTQCFLVWNRGGRLCSEKKRIYHYLKELQVYILF